MPIPVSKPRRDPAITRFQLAERLERFRQSGLTVAQFCDAEGVSAPTLASPRFESRNPRLLRSLGLSWTVETSHRLCVWGLRHITAASVPLAALEPPYSEAKRRRRSKAEEGP